MGLDTACTPGRSGVRNGTNARVRRICCSVSRIPRELKIILEVCSSIRLIIPVTAEFSFLYVLRILPVVQGFRRAILHILPMSFLLCVADVEGNTEHSGSVSFLGYR